MWMLFLHYHYSTFLYQDSDFVYVDVYWLQMWKHLMNCKCLWSHYLPAVLLHFCYLLSCSTDLVWLILRKQLFKRFFLRQFCSKCRSWKFYFISTCLCTICKNVSVCISHFRKCLLLFTVNTTAGYSLIQSLCNMDRVDA